MEVYRTHQNTTGKPVEHNQCILLHFLTLTALCHGLIVYNCNVHEVSPCIPEEDLFILYTVRK